MKIPRMIEMDFHGLLKLFYIFIIIFPGFTDSVYLREKHLNDRLYVIITIVFQLLMDVRVGVKNIHCKNENESRILR